MAMHPATANMLRWFDHAHLPAHLQDVVRPIADLANAYAETLPEGPELTTGLRKLLEAKDCLVRAALNRTAVESSAPKPEMTTAGLAATIDTLLPRRAH